MNVRHGLAAIPLLIAASVLCCGRQGTASPPIDQFANPQGEASRAVAKGDFSLKAINRFTVVVPGVDADYELLRTKFRISVIQGTSDVIVKNDPNSFNNRAEAYAIKYNRYLFAQLGCNPAKPLEPCEKYK